MSNMNSSPLKIIMKKSQNFYFLGNKAGSSLFSTHNSMGEISQVFPHLLMGDESITNDESTLRAHGITFVLSVGQRPLKQFRGIKYKYVEVEDIPEFPIKDIFPECTKAIYKEIEEGGTVYVHCKAGVSRSAAVVIAYLMEKDKITYKEAFDKLKEVRSCIQPNEGFVRQLEAFERELKFL